MAEEEAAQAKEENPEADKKQDSSPASPEPDSNEGQTGDSPKTTKEAGPLAQGADQMFTIRLQQPFIKQLSTEGRIWLARAVVNMLVIDKTIDQSELSYLEDALSLIEDAEQRGELMQAAKKREVMEMTNLNTDRPFAGHFFYYLAMIIAADGKVKTSEVNYLMKICGKLGFAPHSAKDVLRWATDLVKLNKERDQMIGGLRQVNPVYSDS